MSATILTASIPVTMDPGKVRLGGLAPALSTADTGKVRLGGLAPALPGRK